MKYFLTLVLCLAVAGLAVAQNTTDIDQIAATDNQALIDQIGSGNDIDIDQVATTGYNYAGGKDGATDPFLYQIGNSNIIDAYQTAYTDNQIEIEQLGSGNKVVGALWNDGTIDESAAARQVSTGAYNHMGIATGLSRNSFYNKVGLNMWATGINEAYIWQDGNYNVIGLSLYARGGNNLIGGNATFPLRDGIIQDGNSNLVWLNQNAGTDNTVVYAIQVGDGNKLVGAAYCGATNAGTAAYQYSANSYNYLDLEQWGGYNTLGLYQNNANGSNDANVQQLGGSNSAGVYQYANTAALMGNTLWIDQTGGDVASVCQTATTGYNNADIKQ